MRKIEIKDSNGKMVSVEVSEEVYAVLQEENKQKENTEVFGLLELMQQLD